MFCDFFLPRTKESSVGCVARRPGSQSALCPLPQREKINHPKDQKFIAVRTVTQPVYGSPSGQKGRIKAFSSNV